MQIEEKKDEIIVDLESKFEPNIINVEQLQKTT